MHAGSSQATRDVTFFALSLYLEILFLVLMYPPRGSFIFHMIKVPLWDLTTALSEHTFYCLYHFIYVANIHETMGLYRQSVHCVAVWIGLCFVPRLLKSGMAPALLPLPSPQN